MNEEILWQQFANLYQLSAHQLELFKTYARMLDEWNQLHNITRITELEDVLAYHFSDSLVLSTMIDGAQYKSIADVGSGGGFPGIPLAMKYPHMQVVLIEVNLRKGEFLESVIKALDLTNVVVCSLDWRTFLRAAPYDIDLFVARASLHTDELIRLFKGGCYYRNAQLVYWAAQSWKPTFIEQGYITKRQSYRVGTKDRRLVFFQNN